jgi:hypothetical protein
MQEIDACFFTSPFLSLACFFTFYLTFGEIERVTISNEDEIEGWLRTRSKHKATLSISCLFALKGQNCLLIYACLFMSPKVKKQA